VFVIFCHILPQWERTMIEETTLQQAGDSVMVILPRGMLDRLHVGPGDRMFAIETDRGVLLTPDHPDFDIAMQAFDEVHQQYRNTLRKLAE
jgi:hypothetical protein